MARPTAPFPLPSSSTDSLSAMDDIFNVDPVTRSDSGNGGGGGGGGSGGRSNSRRRRRDEEGR